jgi:transposase
MRKINEAEIAREARFMTRRDVILKAIQKHITWIQAADILGITARHMRRLKGRYEKWGYGGLRDCRSGKPRRKRIDVKIIRELCRL